MAACVSVCSEALHVGVTTGVRDGVGVGGGGRVRDSDTVRLNDGVDEGEIDCESDVVCVRLWLQQEAVLDGVAVIGIE